MPEWDGPSHLHWNLRGEHVLFSFLVLNSFWDFLLASAILIVFCILERIISHYHDRQKHSTSAGAPHSHWRIALSRCLLYWIAMILRLCYMLATMTFNTGLIIVIATSLSLTQLIIDIRSSSPNAENHSFQRLDRHNPSDVYEYPPSPTADSTHSESTIVGKTRPRSKSKPDDIFIHPTDSNIARADAMADHLVLEERLRSNPENTSVWQEGTGRDLARQFLSRQDSTPTHRKSASSKAFKVGEESDSEDDGGDPARRRLVS